MAKIKNPTLLKDALNNLAPDSGASLDYRRGIIVGTVSAIMAYEGVFYLQAVRIVGNHLPKTWHLESLPEAWREDFAPFHHAVKGGV